jgi:hypothetical protein
MQALAGKVDPSVGMATHYHANYVVPYWASNLTKIAAVGNHIFYRWSGYWGRRTAFRQAYTGEAAEEALATTPAVLSQPVALGVDVALPATASPLADAGAKQLVSQGIPQTTSIAQLRADENRGTLRIDEEEPQSKASLAVLEARGKQTEQQTKKAGAVLTQQ